MRLIYELWDWDVGHIVNAYGSEVDALAVVAQTAHEYGQDAVATWILLRSDLNTDEKETVAEGAGLAALALRDAPARSVAD